MPSFFQRILSRIGYVPAAKAASMDTLAAPYGADPFSLWQSRKRIDPGRAMEAYTGWTYAAIKAAATDVSVMELRLFKAGKDADERLYEHELLDLLAAVNDYQTSIELFYLVTAHLGLVGNAYLYLEGVKSDAGKPSAIHIMVPSKVRVIVNRDEFPARVRGYEYTLQSKRMRFEPREVLHIKDPDPLDPHEGVGGVQQIAQWIDADNYAMEFNRRFFLNGARIGGFLETEGARTPEQIEYLKASFAAAHAGYENAYGILALPAGVKFTEGGKTQKDMDFSKLLDKMGNRIIAGFRTPRTVLGVTDDVNRANAEATDYVFAARVIRPIMRTIVSYLNEFLVPRYGEDLYLDFKDPVPEDRRLRMEEMKAATGGVPVVTTNEARDEYLGLDPIEGGDVLLRPTTFADGPAADPMKAAPKGRTKIRTRFARNAARRRDITSGIAEAAAKAAKAALEQVAAAKRKGAEGVATMTDDEYEAVWKGFAARVEPYEAKMRRAVEDFNAEQRKEVIGNLAAATKAVDKGKLFDFKNALSAVVSFASPLLTELGDKEAREAAALIGAEADAVTPETARAIDRAVSLLAESYNETTRDLLAAKLEEGLRQGLGQAELAKLVDEVYEFSDEVRALAVARTETFRIANLATKDAWEQSGVVKTVIWYTAADERVCPYCEPLHGMEIPIGDTFFEKGDSVTGSDGTILQLDYSDIEAGSLHAQCRCYVRPGQITLL